LLFPFGIALNVLSRCGTAKDEWFRHGPPTRCVGARSKPLRPVQGTQRRCEGCNRCLSESDSSTRSGSTSCRFG
jgi:hypothetical protein